MKVPGKYLEKALAFASTVSIKEICAAIDVSLLSAKKSLELSGNVHPIRFVEVVPHFGEILSGILFDRKHVRLSLRSSY